MGSSYGSQMMALCLILILHLLHIGSSEKIKGMAFSTGHDLKGYRQSYADQSMNNLKKTCTNYVHISAYSQMPSFSAMTAKILTDDQSIRYIIRKSKAKGFKVFFKPAVEPLGSWRGEIPGRQQWFRQIYTPFILKMAKIAQQESVELFSVGTEYSKTVWNRYEWVRIINLVRQIYKGPITYVGNHDSFKEVTFWDKVDFISISGYFIHLPGTTGYSPNWAQTKQMWQNIATDIYKWKMSKGFLKKEVIIAEIGIQSKGGGIVYRVPWDWERKAPLSFFEQNKMYDALLGAFMPKPWIRGVILWNWELDPNAGAKEHIKGYTPQNKPALKTMMKYYCQQYYF